MANDAVNTQAIARKLLEVEAGRPGSVRIFPNPLMIGKAEEVLKEMGFRKGFFTSRNRFLFDCILKDQAALERMLPSSMLAGPFDEDGCYQCWAGSGPYVGEQGLLQMADFTSGGKDRIVMVIDIAPFFGELSPLLGKPRRRAK
jgi:hypothetical protein